jgi:hypothetical protein
MTTVPARTATSAAPLHYTQALSYEEFRQLAIDQNLSSHERVGFPNSYRDGREEAIFGDITDKLPLLRQSGQTVLDIGSGCSGLPRMLIELCEERRHQLTMVDSEEMLAQLPERRFLRKVPAMFPDCPELIQSLSGKVDVLLCYAVISCIMVDVPIFRFVDVCLGLLAPGGQMLIGDIPNVSKRKRFFSSDSGIRFHQAFTQTNEIPEVSYNSIEYNRIDDAMVFAMLQRARLAGFDAYVLPQPPGLPMANRREDILIVRP